eukprot:8294755-Ditylum_brightwellii.AAC.1
MCWPYTLKAADDRHNKYAVDDEGVSPEEQFEEYIWGYPVYVLDHRIQDSSGVMPKWEPRAKLGINLGRNGTVPPFWTELVKTGTVCVTNEQFDTSATWDMPTS